MDNITFYELENCFAKVLFYTEFSSKYKVYEKYKNRILF